MMNKYVEVIRNKGFLGFGDNILVHLGHYKYLSGIGEIEKKTFRDGLAFGKSLLEEGKNICFRVLVDDIGVSPEIRKKLKENPELPFEYVEILKDIDVDQKLIEIIFESTLRNSASHMLSRKIHKIPNKQFLVRNFISFDEACEYERCLPQSAYAKEKKEDNTIFSVVNPDTGVPLILKEGKNPKCNFIIACSYYEGGTEFDSIISFYNGDWEERMHYGAMVARILFDICKPVLDFYYDDADEEGRFVVNSERFLRDAFEKRKLGFLKELVKFDLSDDEYKKYEESLRSILCYRDFNVFEMEFKERFLNK